MPGKKVTVRLRRGGVRTLSEQHAKILVSLGKAEIVAPEVRVPTTPPKQPKPAPRKAPVRRQPVIEKVIPEADDEPRERYQRRDMRVEE